ncbi:hypothetical protein CL633_04440 [bacterium]|nr:hypothetical protein [bacterium]
MTEKQKKLLIEIKKNLGNDKIQTKKTVKQMLKNAGYSESSAAQQSTIFAPLYEKPETRDIVKQLEEKRQIAIDCLSEIKIAEEEGKDITAIIDNLTKNIELLSGRATTREEGKLTKEQIDEIIERRAKSNNTSRKV